MAAYRKQVAVMAAVLALAGCSDSADQAASLIQLQAENTRLRQVIESHQTDMDSNETQASIAAGCDWLVPICPDSVTAWGRKAQAAGFSGGSSWWFWVAVIGKLAALGGMVGAAVGAAWLMWIRHGQPATEDVAEAMQLIQAAQEKAKAARERAAAAADSAEKSWQAQKQAEKDLVALLDQVAAGQVALDVARAELEKVRAARKALSAFN